MLVEVPQLGQPGLGVDVHAAELEDAELAAVAADPHLTKEYRATARQPGPQSATPSSSGAEQDQQRQRADPVEQFLDHPDAAVQPRVLHVQHRQPVERPDRGPRAGHVDQRAGHHQVDLVALQPPGQPAQHHAVQFRAAQHHHGVRVGGVHRVRHVVERAVHRQIEHAVVVRRQAGAHHLQPVVALPAQLAGDSDDRQLVTDHDHPAQALAAGAGQVQPLAQRESQDHHGGDRRRQRGQDIGPGQIQIRGRTR